MDNGSRRMAHIDPRPARTPSQEQQSYLSWTFLRGSSAYYLYTSLVFVVLVELYKVPPRRWGGARLMIFI